MAKTLRLPRGKRPNRARAAKATAIAINNILARKRNTPPSGGSGVKRIKTAKIKTIK